jgi:hypothetical protein
MKKMMYLLNMSGKKALLFLTAILFVTSTFAQSLTDGLKLYYNFKEIVSGTTIKDQVGNNDGTLINGATIGSDTAHFYLDFPDVAVTARPYMEIGPNAGNIISTLEDFSITFFMWVPTGFKSDFTWEFSNSFNMAADANGHMFFDAVHQKTAITPTNFNGEPGNKLEIGTSVPTDVWFHYAFTFDSYLGTYYVDAIKLDTATFATLPKDLGATQYNWIGRCGYDGGGDLAGQYNVNPAKIADFRLYNRALSVAEVTALANGEGEPTSVHLQNVNSVIDLYPNPFQSFTNIRYRLNAIEMVKLDIYSVDGKKIETLVNEIQSPGDFTVKWSAGNYSSGIYFYRMQIGDQFETGKLILSNEN